MNLEKLKKNWYLILIAAATVVLAVIAVVTAIKLYQLGKEPVAPTAPVSKPKAVSTQCTLTFTLSPEATPTPIECWDECLGTELIPNNTFDSISDWHNWKGPNTIGAHLSSEGGRSGVFTIQTSSNGLGQGCWYEDLEGVDVAGKTLQLAGALKKSAAMTDNPYLALNANIDGAWTTNYGGILPASSAVGSYENVSKEISIGADVDYLRVNFCVWNAPVSTDVFADWVSLKELSDCSGSLECLSASGSYYCLNPECEPPEEQDESCQCAAETPTPTPTGVPFACLDLTKDEDAPESGDTVTFTCIGDPGDKTINHFNFRYQIDGGDYSYENKVVPSATAPNQAEITLDITAGNWHVQCQVCIIGLEDTPECTQWGEAH